MPDVFIRPAVPGDHPQILAIWNPIIRDSLVTFASVEKTPDSLVDYLNARPAKGREFFVSVENERVSGFASYDQFRGGDGYIHAMEHTVILAESARGRGTGRLLMRNVEDHARAKGAHTMVAGISGGNPAAVSFHTALGYQLCGRMPQSGRKFGQWHDLILMQKIL
jgi:phosphinothricin acetyltransferase